MSPLRSPGKPIPVNANIQDIQMQGGAAAEPSSPTPTVLLSPQGNNSIDKFVAEIDRSISRQFGGTPTTKEFRVGRALYEDSLILAECYDMDREEITELESLAVGEVFELGREEEVVITRVA